MTLKNVQTDTQNGRLAAMSYYDELYISNFV